MKKPKGVKYQGVSLPIPLIEKIKKHITNDITYQTVPNYVRDAVREKIDKKDTKEFDTDFDTFLHHFDELRHFSAKMERTDPIFVKVSKVLSDLMQEIKKHHDIEEVNLTKEAQEYLKRHGFTLGEYIHKTVLEDMKREKKK